MILVASCDAGMILVGSCDTPQAPPSGLSSPESRGGSQRPGNGET